MILAKQFHIKLKKKNKYHKPPTANNSRTLNRKKYSCLQHNTLPPPPKLNFYKANVV